MRKMNKLQFLANLFSENNKPLADGIVVFDGTVVVDELKNFAESKLIVTN